MCIHRHTQYQHKVHTGKSRHPDGPYASHGHRMAQEPTLWVLRTLLQPKAACQPAFKTNNSEWLQSVPHMVAERAVTQHDVAFSSHPTLTYPKGSIK